MLLLGVADGGRQRRPEQIVFDEENVEYSRLVDADPLALVPASVVVLQQQLLLLSSSSLLEFKQKETHNKKLGQHRIGTF